MMRVRNKNVIRELLQDENVSFEKILVAENLDQDALTQEIVTLAEKRNILIESPARSRMPKRRSGETHEVLTAYVIPRPNLTLDELIGSVFDRNEDPFFLLINRVNFPENIGVVVRTAFAAGVNGVIFQGSKDDFFNEDILHHSLGTIARIPLVKMNIFDALKQLSKTGIKTFCLSMEGTPYYTADLSGPAAFVLGAEREGTSDTLVKHCDAAVSIPMKPGIDSLNVSASASIVLYEKVRQEKI